MPSASKPDLPTWAVQNLSTLPSEKWAARALGSIIPGSSLFNLVGDMLPKDVEVLEKAKTDASCMPDTTSDRNAAIIASQFNGTDVKAQVSKVLGFHYRDTKWGELTIDTKSIITRTLTQHSDLFETLISDATLKQTLQGWMDKKENKGMAYMIVAIKTCEDAELKHQLEQTKSSGANIAIPVNEILAAFGAVGITLPLDLTVAGKVDFQKIKEYLAKQKSDGERVFAIQVKPVMSVGGWREEVKKLRLSQQAQGIEKGGMYGGNGDNDDDVGKGKEEDDLILCPELPADGLTFSMPPTK